MSESGWDEWKQSITRKLEELKRRIDAVGDQELYLSVARERGGVPVLEVPWPPADDPIWTKKEKGSVYAIGEHRPMTKAMLFYLHFKDSPEPENIPNIDDWEPGE